MTYEYINLEDVLYQIVKIAREGVNYMARKIPSYIRTPEQLFIYLSTITDYRDDPPDTELLQSPKSLFEANYWGSPGTGDCDCFTILLLASLLAMGYNPGRIEIVLAGRSKTIPKHIYLALDGKPMDLTNSFYNYERDYPYLQHIPVKKLWR